MAVRIKFDSSHNPIDPTLVLATKSGRKLGKLPTIGLRFGNGMGDGSELFFKVNKEDCTYTVESDFWNQIVDFKLVWVKEWNKWFEISVELSEDNSIVKNVTAKSLGESELSQINLTGININNETDISRNDYEPTILFDEKNPSTSLLDRLLKKAPHYQIGHVDSSIAGIIRTFAFDNITIYEALKEVAKEVDCLVLIDCKSDADGGILRQINVYDLESYCLECGARGEFADCCDKCGSTNIQHGYGDDTSIYISADNLAENITYKTDVNSVKNCFRLEGGDDLMTATIANCNPNGTNYIWHISDNTKSDMSLDLRTKLNEYDALFEYYQDEYILQIPTSLLDSYNALIDKYRVYSDSLKKLPQNIVGYPALMQVYYDSVDLYYFLNNSLMPSPSLIQTTAELQAANLNYTSLSPVAVKELRNCSLSTANSAVLAMAKTIIDQRYQVNIKESTFVDNVWNGIFIVTNYSDEEDTADSSFVSCKLSDDYESFIKQRIDKLICSSDISSDNNDVISIFKLDSENFTLELKKYCLQKLNAFRDCCQGCLDIMVQQGLSNNEYWEDQHPDLYTEMYVPYYEKLGIIEEEINLRETEINIVCGASNANGLQGYLEINRQKIQEELNFEQYLGNDLLKEFASYRREDVLRNQNFISNGLDNNELFALAQEFIETAKKEIIKSATLQHSISATLRNLLMMKEFEPIVDKFEIGNWIKVRADSRVYKLRLIYYEIDFANIDNIEIKFSDVKEISNYLGDTKKLIDQVSNIATSYGAVVRQAKKGEDSNNKLNNWVNDGLALTKMKIVDSADNQNITWDNHGLLCKEYLPITDSYDDKQLKIINRGLYLTDDNWRTSKAGIGDFVIWNPLTNQLEEGYGVIADTLVGNLILGKRVGIYNENSSLSIDSGGFILTSYANGDKPIFTIQRENDDGSTTKLLHLNEQGKLVLNGSISVGDFGNLDDLANGVNDANQKAQLAENRSIVSTISQYASSASGTIHPSAGWQETIPSVSPGNYLWTKTTYTYGDGTSFSTYTVSRQGVNGSNGIDGANGNDGLSSATIMLFKRSDSLPAKPTVNITYTFSTSSLSSNLGGWNADIPNGNSPCYVIKANVASTNSSVVISPNQWSTPVILVQNGVVDYSGINERFEELSQDVYNNLENYRPSIDQYMSFDSNNGLVLGSKDENSQFKVQITNNRIAFIENNDVTAYINSNQLYITNAVITSSLYVGGYYFTPLFTTKNGVQTPNGMAIVWRGDVGNA